MKRGNRYLFLNNKEIQVSVISDDMKKYVHHAVYMVVDKITQKLVTILPDEAQNILIAHKSNPENAGLGFNYLMASREYSIKILVENLQDKDGGEYYGCQGVIVHNSNSFKTKEDFKELFNNSLASFSFQLKKEAVDFEESNLIPNLKISLNIRKSEEKKEIEVNLPMLKVMEKGQLKIIYQPFLSFSLNTTFLKQEIYNHSMEMSIYDVLSETYSSKQTYPKFFVEQNKESIYSERFYNYIWEYVQDEYRTKQVKLTGISFIQQDVVRLFFDDGSFKIMKIELVEFPLLF